MRGVQKTEKEEEKGKGKGKGKEKEVGAFKRLSRTLTRRSTRGSNKTVTPASLQHEHYQEQQLQQGQQQHPQCSHLQAPHQQHHASSSFSNTFQSITITAGSISMPHAHEQQQAYCNTTAPPVLPDINMDPLMSGTYNHFVDWNQMCSTAPDAQDPDAGMAFCDPAVVDFDSAFGAHMFGDGGYQGQQNWGQGP
jgi:hypothetical protein